MHGKIMEIKFIILWLTFKYNDSFSLDDSELWVDKSKFPKFN